jgi:tubulin polyglutamylase TTLL6/13
VLAQRYVSDPLLIDGCKFGIRLWLLVTGVEPFTAYLHNQGLVLFSTDRWEGIW